MTGRTRRKEGIGRRERKRNEEGKNENTKKVKLHESYEERMEKK
jgi:hypothetical protein